MINIRPPKNSYRFIFELKTYYHQITSPPMYIVGWAQRGRCRVQAKQGTETQASN